MITGWAIDEEKTSACGTACGASKPDEEQKPSSCGTACGASK